MKYLIFLLFPITVSAQTQIVVEAGTLDTLVITSGTLVIPTTTVQRKPYKPPIPPSNAFHISTSGNDANPGTLAAPWKTLSRLNGGNFTDKTVLLKRGDMWREQLTIPSSNLTIGAYGTGARPIINGADLKTGWAQVSQNVWGTSGPPHAMVVIGGVIYSEVTAISQLSINKYFIKLSSTPDSLFIYSAADPNTLITEVSKREYCIQTSGSAKQNVTIDGIEVRYAGRAGIYFEGPGAATSNSLNGNSVVKNCKAYANRSVGFGHWDHYDNVTFEDCEATFNGNGFYSWEADEGTFRRCSTANQIHYDYATGFTDGGGIQGYRSDNWLVENCVSSRDYDAIHIDCGGVAANGIIRYNKIFDSRAGSPNTPTMGVGSSGAGSKIQIYYNLLVNGSSAALECYTLMNGKVEFYNNTIYLKAGTGTDGLVYLKNGDNFSFKNNIIAREGAARGFHTVLYPQMSINDYNVYFNYPPASIIQFYYTTNYTSIAAWRLATGQDMNSIIADPMFVNKISDWNLQLGSPCINKGVDVGLTKDINGNPIVGLPDCGAYERQ